MSAWRLRASSCAGSANGTWRNFYLMGAYELRHGPVGTPTTTAATDIVAALSVDQLFDAVALRVDGPAAWDAHIVLDWHITDAHRRHRSELRNGLLVHFDVDQASADDPVAATFTLTKQTLLTLLLELVDLGTAVEAGDVGVDGDPSAFGELAGYLDDPDPDFAIVTP